LIVARVTDYLLVDISNSYAKLAFGSTTRVFGPQRIPTSRLSSAVVSELLEKRSVRRVVVSSVVPAKNPAIVRAAGKTKVQFLNWKLRMGIKVDYPRPASIGADRLANAAAVTTLYGCPGIVVDFGTAVTFDIVSEHRAYIGGVIAPGLEAMTNFLYQRTALLPKLSLKEPQRAVGKSTIQAMLSGAVFGYRGLVREILDQIIAEQFPGKKVHVVATGGYARLIARTLSDIRVVHPNLTLEGLRIIGNLNS
jgi:type III pantothenate kinase